MLYLSVTYWSSENYFKDLDEKCFLGPTRNDLKIQAIIEFLDPYTGPLIYLDKTLGHEICCSFSNSSVHDPSAQRDL